VVFKGIPASEEIQKLASCLTQDELDRAARFATRDLQARFLWRRSLLRHFLAQLIDKEPAAIRFCYGANGKPEWDAAMWDDHRGTDWEFNLSHTLGAVAIGITRGGRIGVDIEVARELEPLAGVAQLTLSDRELALWRALEPALQLRALRHTWVVKEAIVKAWGSGLSYSPTGISLENVWQPLVLGKAFYHRLGHLECQFLATWEAFTLAVAVEKPSVDRP
jgi:4'-phosphopantetheinyl transferase